MVAGTKPRMKTIMAAACELQRSIIRRRNECGDIKVTGMVGKVATAR
jgi:hypothetical protein